MGKLDGELDGTTERLIIVRSHPRSLIRSVRAVLVAGSVSLAGALVAGCGDEITPSTDPSTTVPTTHSLPTGPDDVVLRVEWQGGFMPIEQIQRRLPNLLVTGDGRVFLPAAVAEIYPGPLVMPVTVGSIDAVGLAAIVRAAEEAGLLGEVPNYELPPGIGIADAATTVVTITVDGVTRVHAAYALGLGADDTPARQRLATFVSLVGDLPTLVGAEHLGEQSTYEPDAYRVLAMPADPSGYGEPRPTVRPWPTDTGVRLADLTGCRVVDAAAVGALFAESNELTFFTEEGTDGVTTVYRLGVGPRLPGESGCFEP